MRDHASPSFVESAACDTGRSVGSPGRFRFEKFRLLLGTAVDGASLAVFRVCFGLAMVFESFYYLKPTELGVNRTTYFFVNPGWNFHYEFFSWARPLPAPWIYLHVLLIGVCGLLVATGLFYRIAACLLAVLFTWFFLLEEAIYLNHFYLMSILCWMMIVLPANRCWSLDNWWKRKRSGGSGAKADQADKPAVEAAAAARIPFWPVFLLRTQLFVLYFYGGIAKLHYDWLAGYTMQPQGRMLSEWLGSTLGFQSATSSLFGPQAMTYFLSWGGTLFDLAIGFLLLCRRTRVLALVMTLYFHASNHFMFNIGVFPFLAFSASLLFCEPDWPRNAWQWIRRPRWRSPDVAWFLGGLVAVPVLGGLLGWKAGRYSNDASRSRNPVSPRLAGLIAVWVAVQVLLPLRHYLIDGDANWTNEGHRFSWRMMLHRKKGYVHFDVVDPELISEDRNGIPQLNAGVAQDRLPPVTWFEFDPDRMDWSELPQLVVLFEPIVGQRIIWNPRAETRKPEAAANPQTIRQQIVDYWQETYGRTPEITQTTGLARTLERAAAELRLRGTAAEPTDPAVLETVRQALKYSRWLEELQLPPGRRELVLIDLNTELQSLALDPVAGELVRRELRQVHPLAMLTGLSNGRGRFTIDDPQLVSLNENGYADIDWSRWKDHRRVFIDFSRLPTASAQNLPQLLVCRKGQRLRIEWNAATELVPRQLNRLAVRPNIVHQYSQRIADWWEKQFGRRPQVFATGVVALNHHQPQILVDPQTDLAAAPLQVFGHNPWIMQLGEARALAEAGGSPVRLENRLGESDIIPIRRRGELRDGQLVEHVTRWYPDGTVHEQREFFVRSGREYGTLAAWHQSGHLRLQAPYVDGQHHGAVRQWHANGTLAVEARYSHGVRHGPVAMWDEAGNLLLTGQYRDGVLLKKPAVAEKPGQDASRLR